MSCVLIDLTGKWIMVNFGLIGPIKLIKGDWSMELHLSSALRIENIRFHALLC